MYLVLMLLMNALQRRRATSYTVAELDEIARQRATLDGGVPLLLSPKAPYCWWKYQGLF